jgi:hypothetical protein
MGYAATQHSAISNQINHFLNRAPIHVQLTLGFVPLPCANFSPAAS